jgi:hypothetical protein
VVLTALTAAWFVGAASAARRDHADTPRFAPASDRSASDQRVAIAADAAVEMSATAGVADLQGAGRKEIREFAECFVLGMGLGRVLATLIGGLYGALLAAGAAMRCL